jgi:hypothetical protein
MTIQQIQESIQESVTTLTTESENNPQLRDVSDLLLNIMRTQDEDRNLEDILEKIYAIDPDLSDDTQVGNAVRNIATLASESVGLHPLVRQELTERNMDSNTNNIVNLITIANEVSEIIQSTLGEQHHSTATLASEAGDSPLRQQEQAKEIFKESMLQGFPNLSSGDLDKMFESVIHDDDLKRKLVEGAELQSQDKKARTSSLDQAPIITPAKSPQRPIASATSRTTTNTTITAGGRGAGE